MAVNGYLVMYFGAAASPYWVDVSGYVSCEDGVPVGTFYLDGQYQVSHNNDCRGCLAFVNLNAGP